MRLLDAASFGPHVGVGRASPAPRLGDRSGNTGEELGTRGSQSSLRRIFPAVVVVLVR